MKTLLLAGLVTFGYAQNVMVECEEAIKIATSVHWDYVNGRVPLRQDKNMERWAENICKNPKKRKDRKCKNTL